MENEIAKMITSILLGNEAFKNVMGSRLTPLYADGATTFPFTVYGIDENAGVTKDGGEEYPVTVSIYFDKKQYKECLEFKNIVKRCFSETEFDYQSSTTNFDSSTQAIVSDINFLITQ